MAAKKTTNAHQAQKDEYAKAADERAKIQKKRRKEAEKG
jgi:hypothetical protein